METLRRHIVNLGVDPAVDTWGMLCLFGIWTQHVWVFWVNTSNPPLPAWLPWQSLYAILAAVMLAVAGWTVWRARRSRTSGELAGDGGSGTSASAACGASGASGAGAAQARGETAAAGIPAVDLLAASVGACATLALGAARHLPGDPWLACAALVCGVACYAWCYIRWGQVYRLLTLRQAIVFLFGGAMVAAVAKCLLAVLPAAVSLVFAAGLPILSVVMGRESLRVLGAAGSAAALVAPAGGASTAASAPSASAARPATAAPVPTAPPLRYTRANLGALWKVAAVFAVFSLVDSLTLSVAGPATMQGGVAELVAGRALEFALCAGLLAYVFRLHGAFDFAQLWRVVLVLVATDLVAGLVAPDTFLPRLFATGALNFVILFIWLALADISHHSDLDPAVVFGVGWSLYALPFFAGSLVSGWLGAEQGGPVFTAVLLYIVCLAAAFLLDARDQNTKYIFQDLAPTAPAGLRDFADIDSRCAVVAARFGLTARELEIMQMLCKGRSKAYIAETLFITENTVRSHAKRMYAKLDVHNRRELQELIEA